MGDGRLDAGYVSFFFCWLGKAVLVWCFGICTYVYGCKYRHEIYYKTPIRGMGVMSLCCHVGFLFSRVIIVNTASSYVIKLHGQYVCFSTVLLRYMCG